MRIHSRGDRHSSDIRHGDLSTAIYRCEPAIKGVTGTSCSRQVADLGLLNSVNGGSIYAAAIGIEVDLDNTNRMLFGLAITIGILFIPIVLGARLAIFANPDLFVLAVLINVLFIPIVLGARLGIFANVDDFILTIAVNVLTVPVILSTRYAILASVNLIIYAILIRIGQIIVILCARDAVFANPNGFLLAVMVNIEIVVVVLGARFAIFASKDLFILTVFINVCRIPVVGSIKLIVFACVDGFVLTVTIYVIDILEHDNHYSIVLRSSNIQRVRLVCAVLVSVLCYEFVAALIHLASAELTVSISSNGKVLAAIHIAHSDYGASKRTLVVGYYNAIYLYLVGIRLWIRIRLVRIGAARVGSINIVVAVIVANLNSYNVLARLQIREFVVTVRVGGGTLQLIASSILKNYVCTFDSIIVGIMHVTGDRNVVRYQIRLNQIVRIVLVRTIRSNIIMCRVGNLYSVIAAIRYFKAVLAVSLSGHIPLTARTRNSNSCTFYRIAIDIGNGTSDYSIARLNCGFDGRNLGGILCRNDFYFIFASLKVGKFIVASFIRLYGCDELMLVIVQIYGSAYIRVATFVLGMAIDFIGTNSSAYCSGQLIVGFYAVAAIVQLGEFVVAVCVGSGSLNDIPLLSFQIVFEQLSSCALYRSTVRGINIAVDSIRMCLRNRRLVLNASELDDQLNSGCLVDGYSLGVRSAVANRCGDIVLTTCDLESCLAISVGLLGTVACAGVRYGCIINRIVVGINDNNLYFIGQGYSQHDVGLVLAIQMDSGLAVGLVAVSIVAFHYCGQVVSAIRQTVETELTVIVRRGLKGLGLIVAKLNSYDSVCKAIAIVIGNYTRSSAVTRRNFRTGRLESQVLSGITLNIDSHSVRLLACCSCVQVVLAKQISVQNNLVFTLVVGVYLTRLFGASIVNDTISNYAAVSIINNTSDSDRGLQFESKRHVARYSVLCISSLSIALDRYLVIIGERRNSKCTIRTSLAVIIRSTIHQSYSYISAFNRSIVTFTDNGAGNSEAIDYKVYAGYICASYLNRYAGSCRIDVACIKLEVSGSGVFAIHYAHRPVAVLVSLNAVCLIRIGIQFENNRSVSDGLAVLVSYLTRNGLCIEVPRPNIARSNTRRIRLAIAVCILSGLVQQLSAGYRILNLDLVIVCRDVRVRELTISDNSLLTYLLILAVKQGYNSAQHRVARVVDNIAAYSYIISNLYCIVGCINIVSSLCVALGEFEAVSACVQTRNRILRATLYVSCYLDNLSSSVVQNTGIKAARLRTGNRILAINFTYLRLVLLVANRYIMGCIDFTVAVHSDAVVARLGYLNSVITLRISQRCGQQVEVVTGLLVQCNGSAFLCCATNGVVTRDCVVSQRGVIVIRVTGGQILCLLINSRNLYLISDTRCNGEVIGAILVGVSYINNVAVRVDNFNQSRGLLSVFIKNYTTDSGSIQTGYAIKILRCCGVSALFKIAIGDSEVKNTGSICAVREYTDIAACSQAINSPMTICIGSSISNQCVAVSAIDVNIYAFYWISSVNAVIGVVNVTIYYTRFRLRFRIRSRDYRISRVNRRYMLVDLLYDILPLNICATYYEVELVSLCVGVIVSVSAAIVIKYDIYHVSAIRQLFKAVRTIGLSGSHSDILSTLLTINYLIQQYNASFRNRSLSCCIGLIGLVESLAGCGVAIQIAVSGRIAVDNDVSIVLVTQIKIYAYAASVSVITILIRCTYSQETLRKVLQFVGAICISSSAAYSSISLGRLIIQISSYRNVRQFKLVVGVVQVIYRAAYIIIGVADSGARLILL